MKYNLHHKPKWMPLSLHMAIENATMKICTFLDPNLEQRLITFFKNLILGFNTGFPQCCVAWYIIDELRGNVSLDSIHPARRNAALDIALALDDYWSGYLPCPRCAESWLNGDEEKRR